MSRSCILFLKVVVLLGKAVSSSSLARSLLVTATAESSNVLL